MMKRICTFLLGLVTLTLPTIASADSIGPPDLKSGDSWVYVDTKEGTPNIWNQTHDQLTVVRVTTSRIYFTVQQMGATQQSEQIATGDWGRLRSVNGKETVVARPLAFPLSAGKSWEVHYAEDHPHNRRHRREEWKTDFHVVGYETVTVPAGTFQALKIEGEGTWVAEMEPGQSVVQGMHRDSNGTSMVTRLNTSRAEQETGQTYHVFWYVPAVKRWVKLVEEYYDSEGRRVSRFTNELESFKLAG